MTNHRLLHLFGLAEAIDGNITELLDFKRVIDHSRTKTTTTAKDCEDELKGKLVRIGNLIKNRISIGNTFDQVKTEFKGKVRESIQKCIRDTYFLGSEYVEKFTKRAIVPTPEDVQNIQSLINSHEDKFWNNIQLFQRQEFLKENDLREKTTLDSNLEALAVSSAIIALASGTKTAIRTENQNRRQDAIDIKIEQVTLKIVWVTERDSSVCTICQPLDNREWDADDPSILTPILDTHDNCRCRVMILENRKIFNG